MFKDVAELITLTKTRNSMGDTETTKSYREVYVKEDAVWQKEFYSAYALGLRPTLSLEIQSIDYQKESLLRFDGEEYRIIRVDKKGGDLIKLVCEGVVNSGTT